MAKFTVLLFTCTVFLLYTTTIHAQTPCASTPCQNGGTCANSATTYNCSCPFSFKGTQCQTAIAYCGPQPSQSFIDPTAAPTNPTPHGFGNVVQLTDQYAMMLSQVVDPPPNPGAETAQIWVTNRPDFVSSGLFINPLSTNVSCAGDGFFSGVACASTFVATNDAIAWQSESFNQNGLFVAMFEPDNITHQFVLTQILTTPTGDQGIFGDIMALSYNHLFIHNYCDVTETTECIHVYNRTRLSPSTSNWLLVQTISFPINHRIQSMYVNPNDLIFSFTVNINNAFTNLTNYQLQGEQYNLHESITIRTPQTSTKIASNGNQIVVGYLFESVVEVYTLDSNNKLTTPPQTITSTQPLARCGTSVSISNNTLAIGCPRFVTQIGLSGAVDRYYRSGSNWIFATRYIGDCTEYDTARLGTSVSTFNDSVLVGDPSARVFQGVVFLYNTPCDSGGNAICLNSGNTICVNDVTQVNNFTCVFDPCNPNPCGNAGICTRIDNSTNGYTCDCYPTFYGVNCTEYCGATELQFPTSNDWINSSPVEPLSLANQDFSICLFSKITAVSGVTPGFQMDAFINSGGQCVFYPVQSNIAFGFNKAPVPTGNLRLQIGCPPSGNPFSGVETPLINIANMLNVWHHYCVTYNYTTGVVNFYLDGSFVDSGNMGPVQYDLRAVTVDQQGTHVGSNSQVGSGGLPQIIDTLGVWNTSLSAAEILSVYQTSVLPGFRQTLIYDLEFNEQSGTITRDSSGSFRRDMVFKASPLWVGCNSNCTAVACQNLAVCNTPTCECPRFNCTACASSPCVNGGTCIEFIDSFTCVCPDGFIGNQCQTGINVCSSDPCTNGGTCTVCA